MKLSEIEIGKTYNGIKVIAKIHKRGNQKGYECLCVCPKCGKEYRLDATVVGKRNQCMDCYAKQKLKDLSGKRYGALTVIERVGFINKRTMWRCKCDCGESTIVDAHNLLSGHTQTCGHACGKRRKSVSLNFDFNKPLHNHPLWRIWDGIKQRCENANSPSYSNYGARGIKVCDRWQGENGFENFVADMGERPSKKHTIDRINSDGDYCPENCRWATYTEQNRNRHNTIFVYLDGVKIPLSKVCQDYNLVYRDVYPKIKRGIEITDILQTIQ